MLNVLLSFAQFEREIIAERTRDKMSAARRKGKWTGGILTLGYDVAPEGGRLVVNDREADMVREIYDLYLREQSIVRVLRELDRGGWERMVDQMISKGARLDEAERKIVIDYLSNR